MRSFESFSSALSSKALLGLQSVATAEESGFQPALRGLYQFPLYGALKRIRQIGYTVASHQLSPLGKIPADDRVWKKGGEKPMSAYEYYGHDDKPKAGGKAT